MTAHSVMLGLPVDASPWAVFEELDRRGFSISIRPGKEAPLRATAISSDGVTGQIYYVEGDTASDLALELVESIVMSSLPARTVEQR